MARFGNANSSSLLKSAQAAYERLQTYNDSIAAYEYELSDKTEADYNAYQKYLKDRQTKITDPSKALDLQKKQTGAYRAFNSSEIQRATLAVNYGDISKTDKYNRMYGLLQRAYANGDMELAGNIESQLASLSVSIQNEANATAGRGRAAASSAVSAAKTKINDLENQIDRAYQTGQALKVDGKEQYLDAASYALNQASILKAKYDIISQQAAEDPKYADDLSSLQKSTEWRSLIDSGMVTFDGNGAPVANGDGIKNLAVSFEKDKYGNTVRKFTAPSLDENGKIQYGLVKPADGSNKQQFVADRQLSSSLVDPSLKSRVIYDVNEYKQNDKAVQGVGQYQDVISGNNVLVKTAGEGKGLRSAAFKGQTDPLGDLNSLSNAKPYQPGPLDAAADYVQQLPGVKNLPQIANFSTEKAAQGAAINAASRLFGPLGQTAGGVLNSIVNRSQLADYQRKVEAKRQQAALNSAYAAQQAAATSAAARAATPTPVRNFVPAIPKTQAYLPTPVGKSPAQVFDAAKAAGKSTAAAIGRAVGYNF